ncbi:lipoprotein [Bordetella pertussis]|nr:lipoprotein [Bordetella pertussis]
MMPAGTPAPIVDSISAKLVAEVAKPAMKQKLEDLGYVVAPQDHARFTRFYRDEIRKWGDVIIQENIERM